MSHCASGVRPPPPHARSIVVAVLSSAKHRWRGTPPDTCVPTDTDGGEDIVGVTDVAGRCVHTPGHTRGSICYHFPAFKLVFTGDTLFKCDSARLRLRCLRASAHARAGTAAASLRRLVATRHAPRAMAGGGGSQDQRGPVRLG